MPPRYQQEVWSASTCPAHCPAYLIEHHPVWVNLSITLGIQNHSLIGPKICEGNLCTFRTHIQGVNNCIVVKVILAHVTNTIAWAERPVLRPRQLSPLTPFGSACINVANHLWDPSLTVRVFLVRIGYQTAVVRPRRHIVWDTIIVIVPITLIPKTVIVRVQLRAVWQLGTVVLGVLMPVSIAAQKKRNKYQLEM